MSPTASSPPTEAASTLRTGLLTGFAAYLLWGIFPAFLKLLSAVSASEILSHRILWSVPFAAAILTFRKQWPEVIAGLRSRRVLTMLSISAIAISLNWLIYVWATINDRILEASLGYYINPLMYVAAGVFVLSEKLRPMQIVSVALATIGVLVLTFGAGAFPWVSFSSPYCSLPMALFEKPSMSARCRDCLLKSFCYRRWR